MDNKNINQRETAPLKLVFSTKLKEIMKEQSITQAELARRMHTSRTAVARVLDP
jgi:DNA-binding XRE family transcriptional regulator